MRPSDRYRSDPAFAALVDLAAAQAGDAASEVLRGLDELITLRRSPIDIAAIDREIQVRRLPRFSDRPSIPPWARVMGRGPR